MGHIGGEKNGGAVGAEGVDSGKVKIFEFLAYKHVSRKNCYYLLVPEARSCDFKKQEPHNDRGLRGAS